MLSKVEIGDTETEHAQTDRTENITQLRTEMQILKRQLKQESEGEDKASSGTSCWFSEELSETGDKPNGLTRNLLPSENGY